MAKVITTELQHSGASGANITLDSSKNVTCENNLTTDGNLAVTGTSTFTGAVTLPAGTTSDTLSFRRLNINGAAQVAQRGSTDLPASPTEGSTYGAVDRYAFVKNGALAVTLTQDTDVPTGQGFGKSMKIDVVTADDQAAADYFHLRYKFEGQDIQHIKKGTANAEKVTLQFWIKSTITGTYVANLYDSPNSRHVGATYTVSSANTWEKKTITFPADTTGTFANSNANSMELRLHFEAGSNFTSGTLPTSWASYSDANTAVGQVNAVSNASNNIYLTGIQIEIGDTATKFEFRPFGTELALCQRYYCHTYPYGTVPTTNTHNGSINGDCHGSINYASPGWFKFPVSMRGTPSCTVYSPHSGTINKVAADSTDGTGAVAYAASSGCFPYRNNDSSGVVANAFIKAHVTADAEI